MGRLITFMEFCSMRNKSFGYVGLDENAKISNKLLKTNVPDGVVKLSKDPEPKIDQRFLITDQPGAIPTLDQNGKIRQDQMPDNAVGKFKGEFATLDDLLQAYPQATIADYAFVDDQGYYYWNPWISINGCFTPSWVKQQISYSEYEQLNKEAKLAVHYIVVEP